MSEHRSWGHRLRSEPLVGFALAGALLFVVDRVRTPADDGARIVIDAAFVEGLRDETTRRTGHVPSDEETQAAIATWVREEALFREAERMGLDRGDVIVRRRLVQKIELWIAAEESPPEPSDAELAAYLEAHASEFARPATTSITICFTALDGHDDPEAVAGERRAALDGGGAAACDPHLSGTTFRERTDAQLRASLGEAVADASAGPIGAWSGPIVTARGLYLVRVDARSAGRLPTLAEAHDAVRDAWIEAERARRVAAHEAAIVAHYEVERR